MYLLMLHDSPYWTRQQEDGGDLYSTMLPIDLNVSHQFPGLRWRLPFVVIGQMRSGHVDGKLLGRKEGEE